MDQSYTAPLSVHSHPCVWSLGRGRTAMKPSYTTSQLPKTAVRRHLWRCRRPLPATVSSAFQVPSADPDGDDAPEEPSNTPPFVFDAEAQGITPENVEKSVPSHASLVWLSMPDLEMHPATEQEQYVDSSGEEDENLEPDGALCPGKWYGRWSRTFIARAQAGLPLGHLDKVVWDADHVWGIKVKLVPLANSITTDRVEFSNGEEGKLRLESYQIRATIQEVYVAPRFFEED